MVNSPPLILYKWQSREGFKPRQSVCLASHHNPHELSKTSSKPCLYQTRDNKIKGNIILHLPEASVSEQGFRYRGQAVTEYDEVIAQSSNRSLSGWRDTGLCKPSPPLHAVNSILLHTNTPLGSLCNSPEEWSQMKPKGLSFNMQPTPPSSHLRY